MTLFTVENVKSRVVFGEYEAIDERHALDVYAQDAGYRDFSHCCEVAPVEDGEIVATRRADTINSAGYIVYDNNATIHGLGATEDEAWNMYRQTMADAGVTVLNDDDDSSEQDGNWTRASSMRIMAASQNLLTAVYERGGDIAWHNVAGVAVTQSEYDAS
jgi:hypothetical protein